MESLSLYTLNIKNTFALCPYWLIPMIKGICLKAEMGKHDLSHLNKKNPKIKKSSFKTV